MNFLSDNKRIVKHELANWHFDSIVHSGGLKLAATFLIFKIGPLIRKLWPFEIAHVTSNPLDISQPTNLREN